MDIINRTIVGLWYSYTDKNPFMYFHIGNRYYNWVTWIVVMLLIVAGGAIGIFYKLPTTEWIVIVPFIGLVSMLVYHNIHYLIGWTINDMVITLQAKSPEYYKIPAVQFAEIVDNVNTYTSYSHSHLIFMLDSNQRSRPNIPEHRLHLWQQLDIALKQANVINNSSTIK